MAVRCMARVLLPLARVNASVFSYGCTPYGASIIASGLGDLIFVVWLHVVWREYYCLSPGLPLLCYGMAVRRMERVLLPLAWVNSPLFSCGGCQARVLLPLVWVTSYLQSYGCTLYGSGVYKARQIDRPPLSKLCLGNTETHNHVYTHIASL